MDEKINSETKKKTSKNAINPGFIPDTSPDSTQGSTLRLISIFIALIKGKWGWSKTSDTLINTLITSPQFDKVTGKICRPRKED